MEQEIIKILRKHQIEHIYAAKRQGYCVSDSEYKKVARDIIREFIKQPMEMKE